MSSGTTLPGLHHVTAIASDAQRNVDFYVGVLGLRLVKKTINYDDPGTYHLYYGDSLGTPGTILTFFPWPHAVRGRRGTGETTVTALAVPEGALPFWQEKLRVKGVEVSEIQTRFDDQYVSFVDPDGMGYELVARPVEGEDTTAIRRMEGVTLTHTDSAETEKLLTETLGFGRVAEENGRVRYAANGTGSYVDLVAQPDLRRGSQGVGTVHHIAWRTPDDTTQEEWLNTVTGLGYHASPVMDRQYFHSIYFREPGGVLFEIATDPPGFTADEPLETLGTRLCLPSWLEPQREQLEARLTPLHVPGVEVPVGV